MDQEGKIHPDDVEILDRYPAEVCLIPASGRSFSSVKKLFARNGIPIGVTSRYSMVLQNGSVLYSPGEKVIGYFPFKAEEQALLLEVVRQFTKVTYLFLSKNQSWRLGNQRYGIQSIHKYDFNYEIFNRGECNDFSKVMCFCEDHSTLLDLARACVSLDVEAVFSMPTIFELTPKGVNKGSGLKRLLEYLGYSDVEIIAAGNDQNDESLLASADWKYIPAGSRLSTSKLDNMIIQPQDRGYLADMIAHPC